MCDEYESHCPPTNIDIGVMILLFGQLGDAADGIDTVQKRRELHRPAQRTVGPLPAVQIGQCGVDLVVR